MKKPTKAQIKKEIAALRKMKPRVLRESGFGDDHHAALDAQIHVLENNLTSDELYEKHDECLDQECSGDDGYDWHLENIFDSGCEAANWLAGEEEISPTENWKPLMDRDATKIVRPSRTFPKMGGQEVR